MRSISIQIEKEHVLKVYKWCEGHSMNMTAIGEQEGWYKFESKEESPMNFYLLGGFIQEMYYRELAFKDIAHGNG